MGLAQAKDLVESLPQTIRLIHAGEIEVLKDTLAQAGFTFEVIGVANDSNTV
jgi:ribosomal protein L7/L12